MQLGERKRFQLVDPSGEFRGFELGLRSWVLSWLGKFEGRLKIE
jgi:hypothetical protein